MTHVTDYNHFIIHNNYNIMNHEDPFTDNIGLVFLQKGGDFLLNIKNIAAIELPIDYANLDFLGLDATAAGFGAIEDPQNSSSQYLRHVSMPVISTESCNIIYEGAVDDFEICTDTSGGRSTCHGWYFVI